MRQLVSYFIRYPIWANIIILLVVGLGIFSYMNIKKSFFPELKSRNITIQVNYPGASPEEIEEGVVMRIEESLIGIEGVEEITSISSENTGIVNVVSLKGYDVSDVLADVKNAVDRINSFPEDAEKPIVFIAKQKGRAITVILDGDVPLKQLKQTAEDIEDDFLNSEHISQVTLSGFPDLEMSVDVREQDLLRYNLTFDDIVRAIRFNNQDISGGIIRSSTEEILIRSNAKEYEAERIEDIVLRTSPDGSILRIKDIAVVTERFSEAPNKTLYNKKNAVTIAVEKLAEEDIIRITDFVKKYLKNFNSRNSTMQLSVLVDESDFLKQRLQLLIKNGTIGLVLVLITLGMFLSIRVSFWVAFAIPFCFLGMFIIGSLAGITINMISLFGMILVIGILVDDGIVVSENIFSEFEKGKSRYQAALDGTMEVIWPVFASVSTTMIAFMVIFFLEGRLGEFIREMAVVVIACLGFSLVEALIILPSHLAYSRGLSSGESGIIRRQFERILNFLRMRLYAPFLKLCIGYRWITLASMAAFLMIVIGMFRGGIIKGTFFPPIDRDDVNITLVLPPGTRETVTEEILLNIEESVWKANEELSQGRLDSHQVILSTKIDVGQADSEIGSHTGSLSVKLLDGETRNMSSFVIASAIREHIGSIPEADKLTVGTRQIFGKPVSVSLTGKYLDDLHEAKEILKQKLEEFPALKDITDNDIAGRREVSIKLKPQAYILGLSHSEIARQVRQGFFGEEIQRLQKGSDEVRVWARYAESDRASIGKFEQMRIKTPAGQEYPLTALVDYSIERGIVSINHLNGFREIKVEADLEDQNEPVPAILEKIQRDILPEIIAIYPSVRPEFKGQQEESDKFQKSLSRVAPIVFGMMLILISLVFRSFSQGVMIFTLIPVGMFCAVLGHGIEGKPVSILSTYGILALSGVIINDAVIFLDKFNLFLKEGNKFTDAVYKAGLARFRAILLTSITTVAGLYPLILEKSLQAQFLVPMAISVAYGVLFGTFFILTYFPAFIIFINDIRRVIKWLATGTWPTREEVEPALIEQKRLADVL